MPGNELPAPFYDGLRAALESVGHTLRVHEVPAFAGRGEDSWETLTAAALADAEAWLGEGADGDTGGVLVGHSLGGLLALLVAARAPAAVTGLALLEPAIAPWRGLAQRAAAAYVRDVQTRDRERFVNHTGAFVRVADEATFPQEAVELYLTTRRAADPQVVARLLQATPALYPLPWQAVTCPVLLVRGGASGWRAGLGARLLARRFRRAALATLPGAGHWLVHHDDPALAGLLGRLMA